MSINKIYSSCLLLCFILCSRTALVYSQTLENITGPESNIPADGHAQWISCPGISLSEYNVLCFRKSFELGRLPGHFIIHISADNTYRLFVNGLYAASGPGKSDITHWYYQTFDLAGLLKEGKNILAVEVVNFGPQRAFAQFSHLTGLYIQGNSETENIVNTSGNSWKVIRNQACHIHHVQWINQKDIAGGFYVAAPTDSIIGSKMPWGWQEPDYNDTGWSNSVWLDKAETRENQGAGGIFYPGGWLLVPGPIKVLKKTKERFSTVIRSDGINAGRDFLDGKNNFLIPANKNVTLWLDLNHESVGYPEMMLSGGKNALIEIRYAESLYNPDRRTKGNRNDFAGKVFIGIPDFYLADGSANQLFRPMSHRAFRFVQLKISTKDEPLTIRDYYQQFTVYPLELKANFVTGDQTIDRLMETGWRTASICAQDILMSDAYYEQMQYVGDSKIHNLALLFMSGNDDLVRNQLKQTDWSRFPDGLTLACYPNAFHLVIPYYSLMWVDMVYDYMMWSGDHEFVSGLTWGIENVLHWYKVRMQDNGLLGPIEWWNDMDWSPGFVNGCPPGIQNGNSASFTLQYAISLHHASKIFAWLGDTAKANTLFAQAEQLNASVRKLCYDKKRGLFAETPGKTFYSQHTNILAVLSGAVNKQEEKPLMQKVLTDKSLSQVAILFRYYLFEALKKSGLGDSISGQFTPWYNMMDRGLTTFTEYPPDWPGQRSDCHPWATSPDIEFFTGLLGLKPLTPGYEKVSIEPSFGNLKKLRGKVPLKMGILVFDLNKTLKSTVTGMITLPRGMSGQIIFNGKRVNLAGGENKIDL